MAKFDSKSFNPEAFGKYVEAIPDVERTELAASGAVGGNRQAAQALSHSGGSLYARIPYFGRIDASTSQNNNGGTDITSRGITTYEQGFITASRMDGWTERSFSKNITAGVDFMDNVAAQIAGYKMQEKQNMLLCMLKGAFSMNTSGTGAAGKAAKEFITNHTYDISSNAGDDAMVGPATLNQAVQKACGDNKNIFKLVLMHSAVATRLENLQLLNYLMYTDKNGIQRQLDMACWNGRTVLVDDNMLAEKITGADGDYTKYTTYILGIGSIVLEDIGDSVPYEMSRDPKTNGGQDTLYVRSRYICGIDGISFEKPSSITASASNDDLANGNNWCVINDGTKSISHKAIALARIISKG